MTAPLHVLLLEDDLDDAHLIVHALGQAGYHVDFQRADTKSAYLELLQTDFDLILADYSLPQFNALEALRCLQERGLDIPFIVITGSIEEVAVDCMKQGAADYLLKDRLARLGEAVKRALQERQLREEKRLAEAALHESEERFRRLAENAPDIIYRYRLLPEPGFEYISPAVTAVTGYSPTAYYADAELFFKLVHPIDRQLLQHGGQPHLVNLPTIVRLMRRDGVLIWIEQRSVPILDADGALIAIEGVVRDVTERKRAEATRLYLASIVESSNDAIISNTFDGIIRSWNAGAEKIFGYSVEEMIGQPISLLIPVDHRAEVAQFHDIVRREESLEYYETVWMRKDGQEIYVSLTASPLIDVNNNALGVSTIARDITEQKRSALAEREQRVLAEALRATATVLNSTLDLDEVLAHILDNVEQVVPHDGANIMFIEAGVARVVRCKGTYARQGIVQSLLELRFKIADTANLRRMVETGQPLVVADVPNYPDWVSALATDWVGSYVGVPIQRNGDVIGFLNLDSAVPHFFSPIHAERLQAFAEQVALAISNARLYRELEHYNGFLEQAVEARTAVLRRTMEQVQAILNNTPDAVLLLEVNGAIESANPAFQEMFGYQSGELHGQLPLCLVSPEDAETFMAALRAVVTEGQKKRLEIVAQEKSGSTFDVDVALAPVKDRDVPIGVVCSIRDISGFKEVERMKDAFVSNVSHELRTPIANLMLHRDLLKLNPKKQDVYMERLEREMKRLSIIVEDLLHLSRLDQGRLEIRFAPVDLNTLVQQYVSDRTPLAEKKGLTIMFEQAPALAPAWADEGLIGQVLSIFLTNALNYTPANGRITLRTHSRDIDDDARIGFSVDDDGPGIPMEERPHLFERFFRGKVGRESGEPGTGLGLPIAQEIVNRHRGSIEVTSTGVPGQGTSITVWLPAADQAQVQHNSDGRHPTQYQSLIEASEMVM